MTHSLGPLAWWPFPGLALGCSLRCWFHVREPGEEAGPEEGLGSVFRGSNFGTGPWRMNRRSQRSRWQEMRGFLARAQNNFTSQTYIFLSGCQGRGKWLIWANEGVWGKVACPSSDTLCRSG